MSQLTFVSTTQTAEQMAADLGASTPADASRVPAGSAAFIAEASPDRRDPEGSPAATPAAETVTPQTDEPGTTGAADTPPAPAATKAAPPAGEQADPTTGEEYPELGGMTPEDFAALPQKTQRRIAKLTRRLRETETRMAQQMAPPPGAPPATIPGPPAAETPADASALPPGFRLKPESDQYETWAEFEEALVDWKMDLRDARTAQAAEQTAAEQRRSAAQAAIDATLTAFTTRRDQVKAERPDWDEVVTDAPIVADDPRKVADLERLVVESADAEGNPLGPDVLYHLGKHKADLDRLLAAATPMQMAMRFGTVLATVEAARTNGNGHAPAPAARPTPNITRAPAPVRPVAGTSTTAPDLDDHLSQAEWEQRREAQLRARRPG